MTNAEIAAYVARGLFRHGDIHHDNGPTEKVQRIEFKGGKWPAKETALGGLSEDALARVLKQLLDCLPDSATRAPK